MYIKKQLVVVLIFAHKEVINKYEEISLIHCYKLLGKHPIRIVCPSNIDVTCYKKIIPHAEFDFVEPYWLSSYEWYNKFKTYPYLYKKYIKYKFVLTYELDAFVFKDELEYWCKKNYDYIGAPWFEGFGKANENSNFIGVGNSGFSLRKPKRMIHFYYQTCIIQKLNGSVKKSYFFQSISLLSILYFMIFNKNKISLVIEDINNYYEDEFWCKTVGYYMSILKKRKNPIAKICYFFFSKNLIIAPYQEAFKFSFELLPEKLLKMNKNNLPFGCHGWYKYNLKFWKSFIENAGYRVE